MKPIFVAVAAAALIMCSACSGSSRSAHGASTNTTYPADNGTAPINANESTTTVTKPPPYPPGPLAPVVFRVKTQEKVVFITIDDGVVRDPKVLALVKQLHLPVTLFPVRWTANKDKTYWQHMQAAGATIEDHTITHPKLRGMSYEQQHHEICDLLADYQKWFGKTPTLFRPPYGEFDDATRRAVNECGMRAVIHWTADMANGKLTFQDGKIGPGDIILLHFKTDLYSELQTLVQYIHSHGYRVGRLESSLSAADLTPATPSTSHAPLGGD